MQYVTVAVASELEAERLKQDLAENPGAPLLTPRWGNAVHATLAAGESTPSTQAPSGPLAGPAERSMAADRVRIREAAARAAQVYPGPVGELLSRELLSWEQFGYRLGSRTAIMQIVDQILDANAAATAAPADSPADAQVHAA